MKKVRHGHGKGGYADGGDIDAARPGEIATTRSIDPKHRQAEPAFSTRDETGHRRAAAENAMFRTQDAHHLDSYEIEAKARGKTGGYNVRDKSYADGGYVDGGSLIAQQHMLGASFADGGMVDGQSTQHRELQTGRLAAGGVVHRLKTPKGKNLLSEAARDRFTRNCKGAETKPTHR